MVGAAHRLLGRLQKKNKASRSATNLLCSPAMRKREFYCDSCGIEILEWPKTIHWLDTTGEKVKVDLCIECYERITADARRWLLEKGTRLVDKTRIVVNVLKGFKGRIE